MGCESSVTVLNLFTQKPIEIALVRDYSINNNAEQWLTTNFRFLILELFQNAFYC